MGKPRKMAVRQLLDKIAVSQEPGFTNSQLMLTNHDLKPGKVLLIITRSELEGFEADLSKVEPARRQWGPWNFVGFWIADSFNIVRQGSSAFYRLL